MDDMDYAIDFVMINPFGLGFVGKSRSVTARSRANASRQRDLEVQGPSGLPTGKRRTGLSSPVAIKATRLR